MKNINWNKIGWITLHCLIIAFFNLASICFFIFSVIDVGDASLFDALTIKYVAKEFNMLEYYHWFNKFLIYLFMCVGGILTGLYLKWLLKEKIEAKKDKEKEKKEEDKQEKLIQKIMEGKK